MVYLVFEILKVVSLLSFITKLFQYPIIYPVVSLYILCFPRLDLNYELPIVKVQLTEITLVMNV